MSNEETFIDKIKGKAIEIYMDFNILPSLTISQACLESAFGKHAPGNNLFGMKWTKNCGRDWQLLKTKEWQNGKYITVYAKFRKYSSIFESLDDYAKLISNSRYDRVRQCEDYICTTEMIKKCGYATSPVYTNSLRNLIEKYNLNKLDNK